MSKLKLINSKIFEKLLFDEGFVKVRQILREINMDVEEYNKKV